MKIAIACVTKDSMQLHNWTKHNSKFGDCYHEQGLVGHNPKNDGFKRIINKIRNSHDWIFMIDDDEYIMGTIPEIPSGITCVRVCSKTFGPEGKRFTPPDPVGLYNNPLKDKLTKCLVKINSLKEFDSHWAITDGETTNTNFEPCSSERARIDFCDTNFWLDHYKIQSYEDLLRKDYRGSIHQKDKYSFSFAQLETIRLLMGIHLNQ
jgi:hypothetical protein